jgi:hypothetical protein
MENAPKMILPSGDYAGEMIYYNPSGEAVSVLRVFAQVIQV